MTVIGGPTLDVTAAQLRALLQIAKRTGSVNAWIEMAMRWIDLASEYIEETREQIDETDTVSRHRRSSKQHSMVQEAGRAVKDTRSKVRQHLTANRTRNRL